jgi:carboxypeptidase Taq
MLPRLFARMQELRDLAGVIGLCTWDQETYLPRKAEPARAAQLSTLQALYHERLTDPRLGEWLAAPAAEDDDQRAMVRVLSRERDRAVKIPERLVRELALAQSTALSAWREARQAEDFRRFEQPFGRILDLRREQADAWGHDGERYDALLEGYEPGMRVSRLLPVLRGLAAALQGLLGRLDAVPRSPSRLAGKTFEVEAQWRFTVQLLEAMGFDLAAGRQDRSVHPFTGGTHPLDVRLTTRLFAETPLPAIFGTIHEGGHGLYEQGFAPAHARTPLAQAPSMGLHESQSRLWENIIGRGRPFWSHFYPRLQAALPQPLAELSLDDFVREVNRVERTFIRVEADEVTYNLHIVLRTELELELVRGTLAPRDLEAAWNEKTRALLGLTVDVPSRGVLQDIHWAWGELGYFPTYTLGNLYAASLWKALRRELPDVEAQLAQGHLAPVRAWLGAHVHGEGSRYDAEALVERLTGQGLTDRDFLEALQSRYGALYGVDLT